MPTNYPNGDNGGLDIFNEPSSPEFTALSSAGEGGSNTRNHVEHHRDLGDAIEAVQAEAARKGHDHSGDSSDTSKGPKLAQANTHQNPDTDTAASSIHHTLGTGATQAAAGNHTHDYNTLTNIPWQVYTTKPTTAAENTLAYETATNTFWVRRNSAWSLLPIGARPTCRLRQTTQQSINKNGGSPLAWQEVLEDNFGYFSPGSPSAVTVSVPGLYHVEAAMQWDAAAVPDSALVIVKLGSDETTIREQRALRGNGLVPGFSQTVAVSGYVRVATPGQVISVLVQTGSATILTSLLSLIDANSKVQSRIDVTYISP